MEEKEEHTYELWEKKGLVLGYKKKVVLGYMES
jgi:hypothetical protein